MFIIIDGEFNESENQIKYTVEASINTDSEIRRRLTLSIEEKSLVQT